MREIHRRFLIILFALLQCLAPLMHAHTHVQGHGGIHLPGWHDTHGHGQELAWMDAHAAEHDAVGMPLSLQPRSDGGHAMTGQACLEPWAAFANGPRVPLPANLLALPGPPSHLIPLPGAPPAV